MRLPIVLVIAASLAACDGEAESLERQYAMAVSGDEKCRIATEAARAWLKRENRAKYQQWELTASSTCMRQRSLGGLI